VRKSSRPLGVTIIGVIQIIESIVAFIAGMYFLYFMSYESGPGPGAIVGVIVFGYPLIGVGIISLFLGIGILKNWMWIWYSEIISLTLSLIPIVLFGATFVYYMTVGIVIDVAFLLYFFKKNVRDYFHIKNARRI
jgi:hypothetical protein